MFIFEICVIIGIWTFILVHTDRITSLKKSEISHTFNLTLFHDCIRALAKPFAEEVVLKRCSVYPVNLPYPIERYGAWVSLDKILV